MAESIALSTSLSYPAPTVAGMGAGQSGESRPGLCGGPDVFDLSCGVARGARRANDPLNDDDQASIVVAGWIAAREAGDVEMAASYCHKEFVFASPAVRGLHTSPPASPRASARAQLTASPPLCSPLFRSSRWPGSRRPRNVSSRSRRRCRSR